MGAPAQSQAAVCTGNLDKRYGGSLVSAHEQLICYRQRGIDGVPGAITSALRMVRLVAWDNCTCLAALTFKKLMVTLCRLLLVFIFPYKICVPMGWVGPPFVTPLSNESLENLEGPPFPINQPCFPLDVLPIRPTLVHPIVRWSYHRGHDT